MKNILLIGGSHGIGAAIAKQEIKEGNNVIIASRTAEDIPTEATHYTFDVTKDNISTLNLPEVIDGLVYCPGSINLKPFSMLKPEAYYFKDITLKTKRKLTV